MQLQMTTDYALRIIIHMLNNKALDKDALVKAKDMAKKIGIDYQYSMKIINKLKKAGFIKSVQGCAGGYYLNDGVEDSTVYDIVTLMEGDIHFMKCLGHQECTKTVMETCQIRKEFLVLQKEFVDKLRQMKLGDVA